MQTQQAQNIFPGPKSFRDLNKQAPACPPIVSFATAAQAGVMQRSPPLIEPREKSFG